MNGDRVIHTIDPVFAADSRVLLLGSIPSPKSREQGFFYGHPRNRMWRVLARVFEAPFPETVEERRAFLLAHHLAMWDVLGACVIRGAEDASIRDAEPNDLSRILDHAGIRAICTTGGKAAQLFEKFNTGRFDVPHLRLPSTSPANAAVSEDRLAEAYRVLRTWTG